MTNVTKAKVNENIQVNFNQSKEVTYWAKKYNVTPVEFQQMFKEAGYSIARLMAIQAQNNTGIAG